MLASTLPQQLEFNRERGRLTNLLREQLGRENRKGHVVALYRSEGL